MGQFAERIRRDDAGFSLAEVLVALVLIALVFSGLVASIISGLTSVQKSNSQVVANQQANEVLENLRTQALSIVAPVGTATPESNALPAKTVRGLPYATTVTRQWVDDACNNSVGAPASPRDYLRLRVVVSWTAKNGSVKTHQVDTLRTPLEGETLPDGTTYSPVQIEALAC